MRAAVRIAVASLLVLASGCATRSHFVALSTNRVPFFGYQLEGARRVRDVEAEVMTQTLLWIPTNTKSPTLQDAVDAALKRGGGNLLVDAEVQHWWVLVPFVYGQEGWRVRGDVVQSTERR